MPMTIARRQDSYRSRESPQESKLSLKLRPEEASERNCVQENNLGALNREHNVRNFKDSCRMKHKKGCLSIAAMKRTFDAREKNTTSNVRKPSLMKVVNGDHGMEHMQRSASFSGGSKVARPLFRKEPHLEYQTRTCNRYASFNIASKGENEPEACSPRVHNLQLEMDLLRTEIQRLKTIDINTYPGSKVKSGSRIKSLLPSTNQSKDSLDGSIHNNEKMPKQRITTSEHDLLPSDESTMEEEEEDINDFRTFVENLKVEKKSRDSDSSHCSSNTAVSPKRSADDFNSEYEIEYSSKVTAYPEKESLDLSKPVHIFRKQDNRTDSVEVGSQTSPAYCQSCKQLEERVEELKVVTQNQCADMMRSEEDMKQMETELQQWESCWTESTRKCSPHVVSPQIEQSTQTDTEFRKKEMACVASQCDPSTEFLNLEEKIKDAEREIDIQQSRISELEAINQSLEQENERLGGSTIPLGFQEFCLETPENSLNPSCCTTELLRSILQEFEIKDSVILNIISKVSKEMPENSEHLISESNVALEANLLSERLQFEQNTQQLRADYETKLQNLGDEKASLMQKVVELRKTVKKESSDKEAAQSTSEKYESSIREHYAEVEQSRVLVQHKKQQISDLEDSLATLQHENEKWERDYNILLRKNEQLEKELKLTKKLEKDLSEERKTADT